VKRLFWVGVGAVAGSYLTRRATRAAHAVTPVGIGENIADGLRELGAGLGAFGAEVRAGMAERERELEALVERRTGAHVPSYAEALAEPPSSTPARAPRAGR
jgi:hypothetical protein